MMHVELMVSWSWTCADFCHKCCAGQQPQKTAPVQATFPIAPQAAQQQAEAFQFNTPSPDDAVLSARSKPAAARASTPSSSRCTYPCNSNRLDCLPILLMSDSADGKVPLARDPCRHDIHCLQVQHIVIMQLQHAFTRIWTAEGYVKDYLRHAFKTAFAVKESGCSL